MTGGLQLGAGVESRRCRVVGGATVKPEKLEGPLFAENFALVDSG